MRFPYGLIYGPHRSIRFGLSLGVDITPLACTFDCVYCERGRTVLKVKDPSQFQNKVSEEIFREKLRWRLENLGERRPNSITFSGSGEPTLNPLLGDFIHIAKEESSIPVRVITNSSLLLESEIRSRLDEADEVTAKMNTVTNTVFWSMHNPVDQQLSPRKILEGIERLIEEDSTGVDIEILLISSIAGGLITNDSKEEIRRLAEGLRDLQPNSAHIHTIRRPPSNPSVRPVSREFLLWALGEMRDKLGEDRVKAHLG